MARRTCPRKMHHEDGPCLTGKDPNTRRSVQDESKCRGSETKGTLKIQGQWVIRKVIQLETNRSAERKEGHQLFYENTIKRNYQEKIKNIPELSFSTKDGKSTDVARRQHFTNQQLGAT